MNSAICQLGYQFLSTPSARRATELTMPLAVDVEISIHALREEGDNAILDQHLAKSVFLSTPSARRATKTPPEAFFAP